MHLRKPCDCFDLKKDERLWGKSRGCVLHGRHSFHSMNSGGWKQNKAVLMKQLMHELRRRKKKKKKKIKHKQALPSHSNILPPSPTLTPPPKKQQQTTTTKTYPSDTWLSKYQRKSEIHQDQLELMSLSWHMFEEDEKVNTGLHSLSHISPPPPTSDIC